jgi:hypothetical protein
MLFNEIIPVYTENHTKPQTQNVGLLVIKAAGTDSYHSAVSS